MTFPSRFLGIGLVLGLFGQGPFLCSGNTWTLQDEEDDVESTVAKAAYNKRHLEQISSVDQMIDLLNQFYLTGDRGAPEPERDRRSQGVAQEERIS